MKCKGCEAILMSDMPVIFRAGSVGLVCQCTFFTRLYFHAGEFMDYDTYDRKTRIEPEKVLGLDKIDILLCDADGHDWEDKFGPGHIFIGKRCKQCGAVADL